jgi:hypothetical protein
MSKPKRNASHEHCHTTWFIMESSTWRRARAMEPHVDRPRARCAEELAKACYWLVAGLEWPGGSGPAQAAFSVAPEMTPRDHLGHDAYQVLGCSDVYARKHAACVVFFSDLTRMFATAGQSWAALGVDWQAALRELGEGPYPAMFLTINEHTHLVICDSAIGQAQLDQDRVLDRAGDEREVVRQAITEKLVATWPGYINGLIESGRVSPVG